MRPFATLNDTGLSKRLDASRAVPEADEHGLGVLAAGNLIS
jgi:hypothetical protein